MSELFESWPHLITLFTEFLSPQDCLEANLVYRLYILHSTVELQNLVKGGLPINFTPNSLHLSWGIPHSCVHSELNRPASVKYCLIHLSYSYKRNMMSRMWSHLSQSYRWANPTAWWSVACELTHTFTCTFTGTVQHCSSSSQGNHWQVKTTWYSFCH